MKTGWMTLGMLAAAAAILLAFPALRDSAATALWLARPQVAESRLELARKVALAHPHDAGIWLAYAEWQAAAYTADQFWAGILHGSAKATKAAPQSTPPSPADAFTKAMAVAPQSPAPSFGLGMFLLSRGSLELTEEGGQFGLYVGHPTPSKARLAELDQARKALLRCHALDPGNAAVDYMLALTALNEGRDAEGDEYLRAALKADRFDLYQRDVAEGGEAIEEHSPWERSIKWVWPREAAIRYRTFTALRTIARYLAVRGDESRKAGKISDAMLAYAADSHLAHVMRAKPFSVVGALVGAAIADMASGTVATEADLASTLSVRDWRKQDAAESRVRAAAFAKWMAEHGRPDLGAQHVDDVAAFRAMHARIRAGTKQENEAREVWGRAAINGVALAPLLAAMLALAVLVLLACLVARSWRTERPAVSVLTWAGLVLLALVPAEVVATWLTLRLGSLATADQADLGLEHAGLLMWMGLAGAVLWLVGALVVARRRKTPVLGMLWAMIWPTVAALVLLAVVGLVPVQRNYQRINHRYKQMVTVGAVKYSGLDSGTSQPGGQ